MSKLQELFSPVVGNVRRYSAGSIELIVTTENGWICRVGLAQWQGVGADELQCMQRAFECAAQAVRDFVKDRMALQKAGAL